MLITDTSIKHSISLIPEQSTDTLAHTWKVLHTSRTAAELKQLQPFLIAIEKELYKRRKYTPPEEQTNDQTDNPID